MSEITFRETVTSADGTVSEGTCTEASALSLLRTALRRGYRVEATRQGGAVIVREIPSSADMWRPAGKRTVTLEPVTPAGTVTDTQRRDLDAIAARRSGAWLAAGRINAGFYSVPRTAAARLVQRGLVTVTGTAVSVSLAARLAMLAQDHRTGTREPRGYVRPAVLGFNSAGLNKGGGRSGLMHDRSSVASCSCRGWSYPAEDRDNARRKAHEHRQEATAAMLRGLERAEAA